MLGRTYAGRCIDVETLVFKPRRTHPSPAMAKRVPSLGTACILDLPKNPVPPSPVLYPART